MVSHCDFAFAVWNILTSPELQTQINKKEKSNGEKSDQRCFMVQGNDSLEVNLETQLNDCASSSGDDLVDADALNNKLAINCENLISKYEVLKNISYTLKEENENLSSKLDLILQEKDEISIERDSLKSQLELVLKENEILKNRNDCELSLIHI